MQRFEALDSLRGISACGVLALHINHFLNLSYRVGELVEPFYLFVDFFFVLSGFVIGYAYEDRLKADFSVVDYMTLRWGRVYPLHFVTLFACLSLVALAVAVLPDMELFGPNHEAWSFVAHAFLLQTIVGGSTSWNFPSWSISAEFWTYLLFAVFWAVVAKRSRTVARLVPIALIFVCPIILAAWSSLDLSVTNGLGLVRCVYGFACGVVIRHIYRRIAEEDRRPSMRTMTAVEIAVIVAGAVFLNLASKTNVAVAAPLVFSAIVLVFAFERGLVSRLLKAAPFLLLGALSYSIYMVHAIVIGLFVVAVPVIGRLTGMTLTSPRLSIAGDPRIGASPIQGDLIALAIVLSVLLCSWLTYQYVEKPGRAWTRRLVERERTLRATTAWL